MPNPEGLGHVPGADKSVGIRYRIDAIRFMSPSNCYSMTSFAVVVVVPDSSLRT
jgi:hypothetical protein